MRFDYSHYLSDRSSGSGSAPLDPQKGAAKFRRADSILLVQGRRRPQGRMGKGPEDLRNVAGP